MFEGLTAVDWVGIVGSIIISGGYLAVSRGWVDARKPLFNAVNLLGATLILISLYDRPNAGAIIIEVLWVAIALFALGQYFFSKPPK
jgi:hypothetical protein